MIMIMINYDDKENEMKQKIVDLSIKMESFIEIYETDKKHMEFFTARMD